MSCVCFASLERWPSCVTSCRNAARMLGGEWLAIERGAVPEAALACDLLVLSAWERDHEALLEARAGPTVVRWHSALLQTELSLEGWKLARVLELLDAGRIRALTANDPALVAALARPDVLHLPDVLDESEYADVRAAVLGGRNVSLFGAPHQRKNLFVQAAAFALARRRAGAGAGWTLHLNGQPTAVEGLARWLAATGVPFVDHGFLDRPAYLSLVAGMDAGLGATLSESYGYVVADHLALGVPIVGSAAVPCADLGPLTAERPFDPEQVADRLLLAVERPHLVVEARRSLLERARAHRAVAAETLAELRRRCGLG